MIETSQWQNFPHTVKDTLAENQNQSWHEIGIDACTYSWLLHLASIHAWDCMTCRRRQIRQSKSKCFASVLQNSLQAQVDTSQAGCTERDGATLGTLWWIWHWATCVLWECLLLKGVLKNNLKRLGWLKRAFCKTFSSSYWNNSSLKYIKTIENHSKYPDTATAICTVLKFDNSTLCLEAAVPGSPDLLTQPSLFQGPCKEFHHVPMQTLFEFFRSLHWL